MAKRPTPKQKLCKGRTTRRYASFKFKAINRLRNTVNLVKCPNCGSMTLNHYACSECGFYRGRKVLDMKKQVEKVTTVKA